MLTEIESCLSTVSKIIEFGMTGGKGLVNFFKNNFYLVFLFRILIIINQQANEFMMRQNTCLMHCFY